MKDSNSIHPCDAFKNFTALHTPDIRVSYWGGGIDKNFTNFYDEIKSIEMDETVPVEIRIQFETAKNVLIYSFYAYRMSTVAKSYAYSVFEGSLTEKIRNENQKTNSNQEVKGLRNKLRFALDRQWLSKGDFSTMFDISNQKDPELIEFLYNHFVDKRNELAHEPKSLDILWHVPNELKFLSTLINKTWKNA